MKNNLLYFLLLLSGIVSAQVNLTWGDNQEEIESGVRIDYRKDGHLLSLINENNNVYLVSYNENDLKIESYKEIAFGANVNTGELAKTITLEDIEKRNEQKQKDPEFEHSGDFILKDKIYVFYFKNVKKIRTYYAQTYDIEGTPIDTPHELISYEIDRFRSGRYFGISLDENLIFMEDKTFGGKDDKNTLSIKIWDLDLKELDNVEIEVDDKNSTSYKYNTYLTGDKKLLYMYKLYIPKKEREKDGPEELIKLKCIDIPNGTVNNYDLNLKNLFILDLNLCFDEKKNAYCAGTFSKTKQHTEPDGTFYYRLEYSTGEISSEHIYELSAEIIQKINNSESSKKKNLELIRNLEFQDVLFKPDGGFYMLFEENYIHSVSDPNSRTITTNYYNSNDILIMNLSPEGEIIWQNVIPKQQTTVYHYGIYNSFLATLYNDKVYIFYNDYNENLVKGNYDAQIDTRTPEFTVPVMVTVNEDGKFEKVGVVPYDKGVDFLINFNYKFWLKNNEIIILSTIFKKSRSSNETNFRFGLLTIE